MHHNAIRFTSIVVLLCVALGTPVDLPTRLVAQEALERPAGPTVLTPRLYLPVLYNNPRMLYLPVILTHRPTRYLPVIYGKPPCATWGQDCLEPNYLAPAALPGFNMGLYATVYSTTVEDLQYDYYAINLIAGRRYTFALSGGTSAGAPFAAPADLDLYLYDPAMNVLAQSNAYGQGAESFAYTSPAGGPYIVLVYAFNSNAAPVPYRLELRDVP
ncbi:MAG: PPC domain-containing protein [Thermoflexales bacterium]|nr:PPC domain-containing protein [Thermoflexales bacterium]